MRNLTLVFIILAFLVGGCDNKTTGPEDPAAAQAKAAQAYSALEDQFSFWATNSFTSASSYDRLNFQSSNTLYKEAIALDPKNSQAQFGAALTELLLAYSDPQMNDVVKRWESSMNTNRFSKAIFNGGFPSSAGRLLPPSLAAAENSINLYKVALTDPPLLSEMQTVLRDKLLPRIVYGLERLAQIEQDSTFRFTISGKMQGDTKLTPVSLYVTEIYMIDAVWQGIRFLLEQFLIYRYDMPDYSQNSLVSALSQNNTSFFVLASDGLTRAQNAKNSLDGMFSKIQSGLGTLTRISGSKSDAVIKLGNTGLQQPDVDSLRSYMQQARNTLTTPFTVTLNDADTEGNNYTIQVFLGALFNNPPQNPKSAFFPTYTVTPSGTNGVSLQFTANTYAEFTFPDPTFGGLFPGMTNTNLKRILYIDEAYGYTLEGSIYVEGLYGPVSATIKLQTSTATYTTSTREWGDFRLVVADANNVPYKLYVNTGSGYIEFGGNASFMVRSKTHEWVSIVLSQLPYSLSAAAYSNPTRVQLTWLPNNTYAPYKIQRGVGTGSTPTDKDSSYSYWGAYWDYNVVAGTTYTYRIRTWAPVQQYMYYLELRSKNPLYSSIVTITP